ncbi:rhamnan synthesis F family protein [Pseudomonas parafulva]|nr:rhamnan synthesis F family protein [Pseudomonas parafulva]
MKKTQLIARRSPNTSAITKTSTDENKLETAQRLKTKPLMTTEELENALVEIVRRSKLFDEYWYKTSYDDIRNLDIDYARHYTKYGWREGKAPSAYFSTKLYLETYSDVAKVQLNPLVHYEAKGRSEHRTIFTHSSELIWSSTYFDHLYYSSLYNIGTTCRIQAAIDYLECGDGARFPSKYFNPTVYLASYQDVLESNIPALLHYEQHGRLEGRSQGVAHPKTKYLKYEFTKNITSPVKRICLFACYSSDGGFSEETVYLLEKVRAVTDCIVLVGDCGVDEEQFEKIKHLVCYAEFERHLEYDFGSYKRAFAYAEKSGLLRSAQEILVCNDSIVGPCGDLQSFFASRKADGNPDFYGITVNNFGFRNTTSNGNSLYSPHIQSYFFTITRRIFNSDYWKNFIYSVKSEEHKVDIIRNYEMGMSRLLEANGYPPKSMYKSRVGLNPAALEPEDVLNKALFIKKSMLGKYTAKKAGVLNGMFKAKEFPFEIQSEKLVSTVPCKTPEPCKQSSRLKIVDCELQDNTVYMIAVSAHKHESIDLLISTEGQLIKIVESQLSKLDRKFAETAKNYEQRSLHMYVFSFSSSLIKNGANFSFTANQSKHREALRIEYIHGSLPCHNFMKHRDLGLYPRIENNTLYLATLEKAIPAILLSENYSEEDKKLFGQIIKSKFKPKYNLYAERSGLACDNAYEAFKYASKRNPNSLYITSKSVISNEKDPAIRSRMIEFGSNRHREVLLEAKNIFCSFGYPAVMASILKDIHVTALKYKLHLMWHGISAGDKNSYEIAAFNGNSADSVLACSQYEQSNFIKLGHTNVLLTGYPRMDKWANDAKLDANALILFFTWRRSLLHATLADFLDSEYVHAITELVVRINKEHPAMNIYYFIHNSIPSKHSEILAAILRSKTPNIRFVNNNDQASFNKIFNTSQYLITDYSSVGYDFAYHKERSPIFYMPAKFISGHYTPTPLFKKIQPGVQALSLDAVMKAIKVDEHLRHNTAVKNFFAYSDNLNCARSYDALNLS